MLGDESSKGGFYARILLPGGEIITELVTEAGILPIDRMWSRPGRKSGYGYFLLGNLQRETQHK